MNIPHLRDAGQHLPIIDDPTTRYFWLLRTADFLIQCRQQSSTQRVFPFFSLKFQYGVFMTITLSQTASDEVKKVRTAQNLGDETFLRLSILGGGCSGINYAINFDDKFDKNVDAKYEFNGLTVAMNKKFEPHFDGTMIEYIDGPVSKGFIIDNPNFPKTGGCPGCGH
jgi:iron-sulfur cluster assembly protein